MDTTAAQRRRLQQAKIESETVVDHLKIFFMTLLGGGLKEEPLGISDA